MLYQSQQLSNSIAKNGIWNLTPRTPQFSSNTTKNMENSRGEAWRQLWLLLALQTLLFATSPTSGQAQQSRHSSSKLSFSSFYIIFIIKHTGRQEALPDSVTLPQS